MRQGLEVVLEEEMFMSKFGRALAGILRVGWCLIVLLPYLLFGGDMSHAQNGGQVRGGQGEQPRFELDEVVVTATKIEESVRNIPRNVTVITSGDIEQAPSNNVVDLLGRESGVNLRSFFGHDKWAGIDLRGMGESFVSNVIVMVDGVKLNPPDLLPPDLSSIPLDQIERIEIVRGAGSVLYGNGAVGGVINIITKKGQKKPETRLYSSYGSYDTFDGRASQRGQVKNLGFNLNADYYYSDGYRDNSYLRKKDAGAHLDYDWRDFVKLTLSAFYHEDRYGLPGRVSKEDLSSRDRRTSTDHPEDFGELTDQRYVGGIDIDLGQWGDVKAHRGYRFRDNDFILAFSPLITKADQTSNIDEDTRNLDLTYHKTYEIRGLEHQFECGFDHDKTEYIREELAGKNRENSDTESIGFFVTNDWSVTKDLSVRLGYRYNDYDGRFRTDQLLFFGDVKRWVNGDVLRRDFSNNVYDAGVVYALSPEVSFFASYATSFRIPNVDEFAQAEEELKPQEGTHIDIGGRYRFKGLVEVAFTLFQIKMEDEIFFDEDTQVNRNFSDRTKRRGLETDVRVYATESLYLWGNYTYTEAKFEDKDTTVPLVPEHKASVGLEWQITEPLVLSLTGTYVGPRFDGNDQDNNRFDILDRYTVFDGKLTYRYKGVKCFVGVNNIFDELYSTIAFSETYYPMPTRNYYGGIAWTF
jgi:TonB-dependent siderophore receptor